jgi:hypothetical protein
LNEEAEEGDGGRGEINYDDMPGCINGWNNGRLEKTA